MNNLSRNKPVAFVVGAAGFIGSHLTEKLLEKGVQVVGCDNFSSGKRDNLTEAGKDKDFHLISQSITDILNLDFPRLDYAVFVINEGISAEEYERTLQKFLDICAAHKTKVVFCSSIDLYDSKQEVPENLKAAEKRLADVALDKKINARVVRLSAVFGPRMNFRGSDPMIRLVKSAVKNKLNEEQAPLEFTTRALFITDAVNLLIKALMHGFTAQKVYDGCLTEPVKVTEIKQLLLDPKWYGEKGFKPTELPPWPTPNLNKTVKELSWSPHTQIITALKETLDYFKSHPDTGPEEIVIEKKPSKPWQYSKLEEETAKQEIKEDSKSKDRIKKLKTDKKGFKHQSMTLIGTAVIFFALIFPVLRFCFSAFEVKMHLENSIKQTAEGSFDEAINESNMAIGDAQYLSNSFNSLSFLKQISAVKSYFETVEEALSLVNQTTDAGLHTVAGAKLLAGGMAVISGEKGGESEKYFSDAKTELAAADSGIGQVSANLTNRDFVNKIPLFLRPELSFLSGKVSSYRQTINLGRSLADLLPQIVPSEGEKSYLVVLEDNRILRPGGGVIRSYVLVTFNQGKLKDIKGDMVETLDSSYDVRIDPPIELKNDLGQSNWRLKEAAFDPDFPTSAKNIAWFFGKEAGVNVSGVIALDLDSAAKLIDAMGPLKIGTDEINSSNIYQKIALTRDGNKVSSDALKMLVERIFYLSKQNWVVLAKNSESSLTQKHLLIYLTDLNSFSYLSSRNWIGEMPVQKKEMIGERNEYLALSETNMTQGQDSTQIDREINLESKLDDKGIVTHKLSINYASSDKLTGVYKNRLKVYLPGGTKMLKTTWGEKDVKDISLFSDFGDSGYSMLLEMGAGEQKQLVLEYRDLTPIKFDTANQLKYRMSFTKQADAGAIPLNFKLVYPESLKVETELNTKAGEISVSESLTQDKNFEAIFRK